MPVLIRIKELLRSEWRQAGVAGRLVYLYYFLFFISEVYYIAHLNIVVIGGS